jgi:hypothetical protein
MKENINKAVQDVFEALKNNNIFIYDVDFVFAEVKRCTEHVTVVGGKNEK